MEDDWRPLEFSSAGGFELNMPPDIEPNTQSDRHDAGFLPEYAGDRRKGAYKDWRKNVDAYRFGFDVAPKKLAPRIWLKLRGEARQAVEHLTIEELAVEDGVDKLLGVLDKSFGQLEVDRLE